MFIQTIVTTDSFVKRVDGKNSLSIFYFQYSCICTNMRHVHMYVCLHVCIVGNTRSTLRLQLVCCLYKYIRMGCCNCLVVIITGCHCCREHTAMVIAVVLARALSFSCQHAILLRVNMQNGSIIFPTPFKTHQFFLSLSLNIRILLYAVGASTSTPLSVDMLVVVLVIVIVVGAVAHCHVCTATKFRCCCWRTRCSETNERLLLFLSAVPLSSTTQLWLLVFICINMKYIYV